MKKVILATILLIVCTQFNFAQKIKFDGDTVLVDGNKAFILDMVSASSFNFKLKTLDGKQVAFLQFNDFYDTQEISSSNPKGRVTYFEVTFLESELKCEMPNVGLKKQIAKYINESEIIRDNVVNEKAIQDFVLIHGMKFTERKNKSTTIYIVR